MRHNRLGQMGILAAFASLVLAGSLQAQSRPGAREGYEVTAVPDHADGLYKSGEAITFALTVTKNGMPLTEGNVAYQFTINDTIKAEAGEVPSPRAARRSRRCSRDPRA